MAPASFCGDNKAVTGTKMELSSAVETYLTELGQIRASGGATGERSYYGPLANLLNAVGGTLKHKVICVGELADQGAGHPDFGPVCSQSDAEGPAQGRPSARTGRS